MASRQRLTVNATSTWKHNSTQTNSNGNMHINTENQTPNHKFTCTGQLHDNLFRPLVLILSHSCSLFLSVFFCSRIQFSSIYHPVRPVMPSFQASYVNIIVESRMRCSSPANLLLLFLPTVCHMGRRIIYHTDKLYPLPPAPAPASLSSSTWCQLGGSRHVST